MKQVNCDSCEYRWCTRQYLQIEECQNVLSKKKKQKKQQQKQQQKKKQ